MLRIPCHACALRPSTFANMRLKPLLLFGLMVSPTLFGDQLEEEKSTEFTVYTSADHVKIHWRASHRSEIQAFSLERSRDGKSFEEIKLVHDDGETPEHMEFYESDFKPFPGWSYYRITEHRVDGNDWSTHTVPVFFGMERMQRGEVISPDPMNAEQTTSFKLNEFEHVTAVFVLRDAQGQEYYYEAKIFIDADRIKLPTTDAVPAGLYSITACSKDALVGLPVTVE